MNRYKNPNSLTTWLWISLFIHLLAISSLTYLNKRKAVSRDYYAPVYKVNLVSLDKPKPLKTKRPKETTSQKKVAAPVVKTNRKTKKTTSERKSVPTIKPEAVDTDAAIEALRKKMEPALAVEKIREKLEQEITAEDETITGETVTASPEIKTGVKKVNLEEMDKALQDYYDNVWGKIKSNWVLPGTGDFSGMTAIVSVIISASGQLIEVTIEEGSGNGFYDRSALRAVKKAQPFPPLPEGYNKGMEIGFRFRQ